VDSNSLSGNSILDLSQQLIFALEKLTRLFKALYNAQGQRFNLSPVQIQILIYLVQSSENDRTLTALSLEFHTTKASLSESINNLLNKKLISKRRVKNDNRSQIIQLSAKGKKLAIKAGLALKLFESPIQSLSKAEKQRVLKGLIKIVPRIERKLILK